MFNTLAKILLSLVIILTSPRLLADSAQAITLHIEVPFVELHSGPSAGYPVVHIIEKNEDVIVLVKRTSWLKVKDKRGIEGWLHQDDLLGLSQYGKAINQDDNFQKSFQSRDVEGGVMYGDLAGANFYNVHLGYAFTSVFSAEVSIGKALGNISDSNLYEVMLISQPMPEWTVIPYIGIGGGFIDTKPHSVLADAKKRQSTLMSAAAGIKYHIARNFLLRAEYKLSLALTDRDTNEEIHTWKIGFSVFF
ncbi:MAG: outer membrane beta-barrel protein [Colwellia sp.]|nr:outer membrane beta-barrel protein [Colwellia sp.]